MKERWRDVVGYEGFYWISDLGRVRGKRCELTPSDDGHGRLKVNLSRLGVRRTKRIHSMVLEAFVGPRGGMESMHLNGDPTDNRLVNLLYGTQFQNTRARVALGERIGRQVLKPHQVRAIRESTRPRQEIADEYGIGIRTVYRIRAGEIWGWLE